MKVLIIDDEPNVREGLKKIIPWEAEGFDICGEGIDGQDGLEKIMILNPDLVLIDIRMPGLMGIEVIEEAKKRGFKGKFIITTGYSDFTYAKRAMGLGVEAYILKPIDEDELIEMIEKIKDKILKEKEITQKLDVSETYVIKSLLTHLLLGSSLSIMEQDKYNELKEKNENYQLLLVDIEEKKETVSLIEEQIKDYLEARLAVKTLIVEKYLLIIIQNKEQGYIDEAIDTLQEKLAKRYQITCKMALDTSLIKIQEIGESYTLVKELLNKKFLYPNERLLTSKRIDMYAKESEQSRIINVEHVSEQIYRLLQVGDMIKIKQVLEELKLQLQSESVRKDKVISVFSNILVKTGTKTIEANQEVGKLLPSGEQIIEVIYHCRDVEDVIEYIEEQLRIIVQEFKVSSPENNMKKIIYYIENNYNKELKLELLAELFNYNSAYLGKSFKNYTGQSFNVYIDQLRINRAKELLRHKEMKVYEIAKAVGYKHIDYFHSKFKKYVGISPLEYKKNCEK